MDDEALLAQFFDGGAWRTVSWPAGTLFSLSAITRAAAGEYWAIGFYQAQTNTATGISLNPANFLLHYLNGVWTKY